LIRKRGYLFFTRDKLPEQTITNIYRKYLSCDKQNQFTVKSSKPGIYYFCIRNDKKKTMKILILCSDNSCLSQMAQGWLQSFDKSLTVCSAGISPAIEVHPLAVQTLASSGIDISHHKPEAVEEYIDEPWDYVITVSRDAEENCPAFTGKVRNLIHSNFYNPTRAKGTPESIANEFRRISNQIKMKMYDLYCDEIQNGGYGPTCTCGANRFCRCN
jgi:arsenate reductase